MKKRSCIRFHVPGATLSYKKRRLFWGKASYCEDCFPVVDISRGGASFVCGHRIAIGSEIVIRVQVPGMSGEDQVLTLLGTVRWANKNPEASYPFQIGVSFHPYGSGKKNNPPETMQQLKNLEAAWCTETEPA